MAASTMRWAEKNFFPHFQTHVNEFTLFSELSTEEFRNEQPFLDFLDRYILPERKSFSRDSRLDHVTKTRLEESSFVT